MGIIEKVFLKMGYVKVVAHNAVYPEVRQVNSVLIEGFKVCDMDMYEYNPEIMIDSAKKDLFTSIMPFISIKLIDGSVYERKVKIGASVRVLKQT